MKAGWPLLRELLSLRLPTLTLGVLAGLVWYGARMSVPHLLKTALDEGLSSGDGEQLRQSALGLGFAALFVGLCTALRHRCAVTAYARTEEELRDRICRKVHALPAAFHDRSPRGRLLTLAGSDVRAVSHFFDSIPSGISIQLVAVGALVTLFFIHPTLTLLSVTVLPFTAALAYRMISRQQAVLSGVQQARGQLAGTISEALRGIRVVKGLGAEEALEARMGGHARLVRDGAVGGADIQARLLPWMELLPAGGLAFLIWYGGTEVLEGRLTLGELVAFQLTLLMLMSPVRRIGFDATMLQKALTSTARLTALFAEPPQPDGVLPLESLPEARGGAELQNVRFHPPSAGRAILEGLSLKLLPGEIVALAGATGSGKSSVGRLLLREYDPDEGRVLVDGVDARSFPLAELRRRVTIAFEEPFLFSDTLRMNLSLAAPGASQARLEAAAVQAKIHAFIAALPMGYDTVVGDRGFTLSGGQRQRLALARALLANTPLLVLDDASSSLDPATEHEVLQALRQAPRRPTVLLISHRAPALALADRVVLLERGRVIAEGPHQELLRSSEAYVALLAEQGPSP